eukprot:COSAG05_NODE_7960_length_751_cov_6.245882_1_plen_76_part_10
MQKMFRGNAARAEFLLKQASAVKMQRVYRGRKVTDTHGHWPATPHHPTTETARTAWVLTSSVCAWCAGRAGSIISN